MFLGKITDFGGPIWKCPRCQTNQRYYFPMRVDHCYCGRKITKSEKVAASIYSAARTRYLTKDDK